MGLSVINLYSNDFETLATRPPSIGSEWFDNYFYNDNSDNDKQETEQSNNYQKAIDQLETLSTMACITLCRHTHALHQCTATDSFITLHRHINDSHALFNFKCFLWILLLDIFTMFSAIIWVSHRMQWNELEKGGRNWISNSKWPVRSCDALSLPQTVFGLDLNQSPELPEAATT